MLMVYKPLKGWLSSFTLFPARCLCCGANSTTKQDLCRHCKAHLPWQEHSCPRCALPLSEPSEVPCGECQTQAPHFARALAPFRYAAPISSLINGLKHHDRQANGRVLSELFCDWLSPQLMHDVALRPDILLPVPLHWSRLWRRGFNQAQTLAQDISQHCGIAVSHDCLQRQSAGIAQQALTRQQRQRNLQHAFQINPKRIALIKNKHIAIIDDVITTGSTANSVAKILMENGATCVSVWALARTPKQREH
jgi:ComF family protein